MIRRGLKQGFTIVELAIVIVILAVLTTMLAVMYNSAQTQSRDVKIRDAADKLADSVKLFIAKNGRFPNGGSGSTSVISGSECANGSGGFAITGSTCTIGESLIASGYLPSNFFDSLPQNTTYSNQAKNYSLMVFNHDTTNKRAVVLYTLEGATPTDDARFDAAAADCGSMTPTDKANYVSQYNMRGMICIKYD